jgi:hypothetical protein
LWRRTNRLAGDGRKHNGDSRKLEHDNRRDCCRDSESGGGRIKSREQRSLFADGSRNERERNRHSECLRQRGRCRCEHG